jgi:hypothetical protein
MANRRTLEEQIEMAQKELKEREARVKELLGRQRSKTDKERTHRLCKRGGYIEKVLPGVIVITDEQFETFVKETLLTGYAEKVLMRLTKANAFKPNEPEKRQGNDGVNGNYHAG